MYLKLNVLRMARLEDLIRLANFMKIETSNRERDYIEQDILLHANKWNWNGTSYY